MLKGDRNHCLTRSISFISNCWGFWSVSARKCLHFLVALAGSSPWLWLKSDCRLFWTLRVSWVWAADGRFPHLSASACTSLLSLCVCPTEPVLLNADLLTHNACSWYFYWPGSPFIESDRHAEVPFQVDWSSAHSPNCSEEACWSSQNVEEWSFAVPSFVSSCLGCLSFAERATHLLVVCFPSSNCDFPDGRPQWVPRLFWLHLPECRTGPQGIECTRGVLQNYGKIIKRAVPC